MNALYRMRFALPSLLLALPLAACDGEPPQRTAAEPPSTVYSEALQEAEAVKRGLEARNREHDKIDQILGR
jgi:hypothetical protein